MNNEPTHLKIINSHHLLLVLKSCWTQVLHDGAQSSKRFKEHQQGLSLRSALTRAKKIQKVGL